MIFLLHFTLTIICGPSIIIGDPNPPPLKQADMDKIVDAGSSIITDSNSNKHQLKLLKNAQLGGNNNVIVWKGTFDNITVAIKIVWDEESMNDEVKIYQTLKAMENARIEEQGIPKIYYHGKVLSKYFAIVMTLFDGTLKDRYECQNKHFSDLSVLLIFKRLVEVLRYIHSKHVVHNDLKPQNIFLRGSEVFIGDFDVATLNGEQNQYGSPFFASKNLYAGLDRFAMDDFESLVYTIWYVASVPMSPCEGKALLDAWGRRAKPRMLEKCKHFKNKDVKKAVEYVCTKEIITERKTPNYDQIIKILTETVSKVRGTTDQIQFEWLMEASTGGSSSIIRPVILENDTSTKSVIIPANIDTVQSTRSHPFGTPTSTIRTHHQESNLKEKMSHAWMEQKLNFQLVMLRNKSKMKGIKLY